MIKKFCCKICDKQFLTQDALNGHAKVHGSKNSEIVYPLVSCIFTKKCMYISQLEKYQKDIMDTICDIHQCLNCQKFISISKKYCCRSCGTSYSNSLKGERSETDKSKIRNGVKKSHERKKIEFIKNFIGPILPKEIKPEYVGEYSTLYTPTCKNCNLMFVSRKRMKYCKECNHLYCSSNKMGYKFKFNVYHYPELFDLELLKSIGWFSPGGKSGKWNPNGLSRDHKVSVSEAIKMNYGPFYISHPLNCELMSHSENNIKKTKSSILYADLVSAVDEYERAKLCR